jgi:hypothetical protein
MHRKIYSLLLTVALVAGLLAVSAAPASANHLDGPPPASLLPDDDNVGGVNGHVLSDRNDGTDGTAHLTALAPPFVERVQWRKCPTTVTAPIDNADIAACSVILGEDAEGKPLGAGTGFPPASADEAYELNLDITATMESDSPADVITLGCNATAGEALANCVVVLDEDIRFDDSASGLPGTQSSTGEMFAICTSDTDLGPGAGATNVCQVGGAGAGTPEEVAARFKPWTHGDPVPNNGFVVRASTSPDLNVAGAVEAFRDWTGIGGGPGTGESDSSDSGDIPCTVLNANATRAIWECVFADAAAADDNVNQEVGLFEEFGAFGQGQCTNAGVGACLLDAHGTQSQARAAQAPKAYFVRGPDNQDVEVGSSCATPDTEDDNALEAFPPGDPTRAHGCVQDQFGDAFLGGGAATFEQTDDSVGFLQCVTGTPEDAFDNDFDVDRCSGVTNAPVPPGAAFAQYPVDLNSDGEAGVQTVIFCLDQEPAAADPEHGCADEAAAGNATTLTKNWIAVPNQVFLAFGDHVGDPEACRTGRTFKRNRVGQNDIVTVCTFDANGNPQTTEGFDVRLQWFIETTVGGERTAVRFRQAPPQQTGADGTASVGIHAFRGGSNFIQVRLIDIATGGDVVNDFFEIEKRVRGGGGGGGRVQSQVTIRGSFKGQVVSEAARCEKQRKVFLKKKRPGKDRTVGTDRTNNAGNWNIHKSNPNGRYYAKIKRTARCTGDRSPTVNK